MYVRNVLEVTWTWDREYIKHICYLELEIDRQQLKRKEQQAKGKQKERQA